MLFVFAFNISKQRLHAKWQLFVSALCLVEVFLSNMSWPWKRLAQVSARLVGEASKPGSTWLPAQF